MILGANISHRFGAAIIIMHPPEQGRERSLSAHGMGNHPAPVRVGLGEAALPAVHFCVDAIPANRRPA